ncbi:MAG: hypothetical protein ABH824_06625 [Nanoarchaeota archaeon]|nr:hypothetical protein [Nanoarchaeota archaeon]
MGEVKYQNFEKFNLKVGKIKAVKQHPKTDDYILLIDISSTGADKQLVANLKKSYSMEKLIGKEVVLLQNTEIKVIKGIESQGLLLVTYKDGKPILLQPEKSSCVGARVSGLNNAEVSYVEKEKKTNQKKK